MLFQQRQSELALHGVEPRRGGFTLVELLVAMSIFVILATLTVAGFRSNTEADRITNTASTFRSALEGARSRAIKAGEIRGLRLNPDPGNSRIATSLAYIGSPGVYEGVVYMYGTGGANYNVAYPLGYYIGEYDTNGNGYWDSNDDVDGDGINDQKGWFLHDPNNPTVFANFLAQGLLLPGCRVQFSSQPNDNSGKWYTIARIEYDQDQSGSFDVNEDYNNNGIYDIILAEFFQPSIELTPQPANYSMFIENLNPPSDSAAYGAPIYYRLELYPQLLPGSQPIQLPKDACIDLDASRLPSGWRAVEDLDLDGSIDHGETDLNGSGYFEFSVGYYPSFPTNYPGLVMPMDILFTPQGTLAGAQASEGVLHFVVGNIADAVDAQQNIRTLPLGNSFSALPYPSWWIQADAEYDRRVVSIFTQSGTMTISDVYTPGDTDGVFNNEAIVWPNNPFQNALRGREAKQ